MSSLAEIRNRFVPILNVTAQQYQGRVPAGYPNLVDDVDAGVIGLEIDSNFSLYVTEDEEGVFVEIYKRESRIDTRATSSRQKYGGMPFTDRRKIDGTVTDQELRNFVAELKQAYNTQPGLIYITDD